MSVPIKDLASKMIIEVMCQVSAEPYVIIQDNMFPDVVMRSIVQEWLICG